MIPIPLSVLTQSMTWRPPSDDPDAMDGEYGEERTCSHVRYEPTRRRASGGYASEYERYDGPQGRIFFDARNSIGEVPCVGALVSVDGGPEMSVQGVVEYRGYRCVHHYEIEVI